MKKIKKRMKKVKVLSAVLCLTLFSEFVGETNVMAGVNRVHIGTDLTEYEDGIGNDVYDNFRYEKNGDGNTITIINYDGNEDNIEIPSTIDGLKVTVIKDNAFAGAKMKSVKIPEGITTIEEYAFYGCSNLEEVTISSSVTHIGLGAFEKTLWMKAQEKKNPVVVVNGILINGKNCGSNVTVPKGVTKIGEGAFEYATQLKHIQIPSSVTEIEAYAFLGCRNLKNIKLPNKITQIGTKAFEECSNIKSMDIPKSVTKIGAFAFRQCSSLKKIEIPKKLTNIGSGAFAGTAWLKNQREKNPLVIVNGVLIDGKTCKGKVVISKGVTTIGAGAFQGASKVKM